VSLDERIAALEVERRESWGPVNRQRLRAVRDHAGHSLLDLGCATGAYVDHLNARGYRACGLDLLSYAQWRQASPSCFVRGDVPNLPFSGQSFDTVLAFDVLEHIPELQQALEEIRRICRRNLIVTVPDCSEEEDLLRAGLVYTHWLDRSHCHFFTMESLRETLEGSGFRMALASRILPVLPDFPVLRSFGVPHSLAFQVSRVMARLPFRKQYRMTLLAVAAKT
jgi:ubiquinone/menaquinone biosynthesis C-methylase UbiE